MREGARSRANLLGISPHDTGARSRVKPNLASSIKFCSGSRPTVGGRDPEQKNCSGSRPDFWGEIPSKMVDAKIYSGSRPSVTGRDPEQTGCNDFITVFFRLLLEIGARSSYPPCCRGFVTYQLVYDAMPSSSRHLLVRLMCMLGACAAQLTLNIIQVKCSGSCDLTKSSLMLSLVFRSGTMSFFGNL